MTHRTSQRARLLHLLEESAGKWVPLLDILALNIAQYGARVFELRRQLEPQRYRIENRTERIDGVLHSWFRLVLLPSQGNLFGEPREAERASFIGGRVEGRP